MRDDSPSPAEKAMAGGVPQQVAWFRFYFADHRWEWSAQAEQIYGYKPGTATPTTQLILSHNHPDDVDYVAATINDVHRNPQPFSTRHRIITRHGDIREIIVIGERLYDDNCDTVIGTQGFYIDVTPGKNASVITQAVSEIADGRAVIERAKGILMFVYRIDAEHAFDILKWRSQLTNVKLRALAEQLLTDLRQWHYDDELPNRSRFDHLLLTVHQRVNSPQATTPEPPKQPPPTNTN